MIIIERPRSVDPFKELALLIGHHVITTLLIREALAPADL